MLQHLVNSHLHATHALPQFVVKTPTHGSCFHSVHTPVCLLLSLLLVPLLSLQVIALVHRCKAQFQHQAVAASAQHILQRWQWQLAGHMHVLSDPVYMEDHAAVLEDEITCGMVPVPQLPKHKLVGELLVPNSSTQHGWLEGRLFVEACAI